MEWYRPPWKFWLIDYRDPLKGVNTQLALFLPTWPQWYPRDKAYPRLCLCTLDYSRFTWKYRSLVVGKAYSDSLD
eukprot:6753222-Karenia_brevis.AAC.1